MSKGLPRARKAQSKAPVKLTDRVLQTIGLKRKHDEQTAKGPKGFAGRTVKPRTGLRRFLPAKK